MDTDMLLAKAFVSKRNNFGAVRLAAAMAVVVSHSFFIATGHEVSEPLLAATGLSLGQHAVNIFFGLSGFLILASWERTPDPLRFMMARFLRIMPGLAAAAVVMVFAGMLLTHLPLAAYAHPEQLLSYIARIVALDGKATLPGVFEDSPATPITLITIWTLKYEAMAYVGVLAIGLLNLNRNPRFIVLALAGFTVMEAAIMLRPEIAKLYPFVDHSVRFGFCFALGMAAWRFRASIHLDARFAACAIIFLVAAALFGGAPRIFLYVAEIYAVLWIAMTPSLPVLSMTEGTDLSYGIYLYGWPIGQALETVWPGLDITALAAGAAALSWTWIERPSLAALPHAVSGARRLATRLAALATPYQAENEQQQHRAKCRDRQALPKAAEGIAKLAG